MAKKTVVAVSYGDSRLGQPVSCEVFTRDPGSLAPGQLRQEVAGFTPYPGELDNEVAVRARYDRLRRLGGHVEAVPSHALDMGERVTGSAGREVTDADYSEQIGQVLVFDAEVDDVTGEVDWYTAMPHPETDPRSLRGPEDGSGRLYRRRDLAILSTSHLDRGQHQVRVEQDGRYTPVNEFDQPVVDLPREHWDRYLAADFSHLERESMVICARPDANGDLVMTSQRPDDVARTGELIDPVRHGFLARSLDYEVLREQAGDAQKFIYDDAGAPVWVAVVDVAHDKALDHRGGSYPFDALSAAPNADGISVVEPEVARDGSLRVRLGGAQYQRPAAGLTRNRQMDLMGQPVGVVEPDQGGKPGVSEPISGIGAMGLSGSMSGRTMDRIMGRGRDDDDNTPPGGGMAAMPAVAGQGPAPRREPRMSHLDDGDMPTGRGNPAPSSRRPVPRSTLSPTRAPRPVTGYSSTPGESRGTAMPLGRSAAAVPTPAVVGPGVRPTPSPRVDPTPQQPPPHPGGPVWQGPPNPAVASERSGMSVKPAAAALLGPAIRGVAQARAQGRRFTPLAGMNAAARTAAATYGPKVMDSAKAKLADPQVRQDLKTVAKVGLQAAVVSRGGGKARGAAAAGAVASQLHTLPTVDRVNRSIGGVLGSAREQGPDL